MMWTSIISAILVKTLLWGLFATLITRVAGMVIDFPFIWLNVGKVWLALVCFNLLIAMVRK